MNTVSALEAPGTLPVTGLPPELFRLVKTSRHGRRYYFREGVGAVIDVVGGGIAYVANCGLLPSEAYTFTSQVDASRMAAVLNDWPVSDARWIVEPVDV
ncbi:hypothetical protein J7481_19715 [Labrenzia sp. R4_2]|uniref:hypothetical protein n=1 Tax=Labrenzia sp. R4_2 TaxID=2821107 RepID=UPI001ADB7360|nr:hypothetical protein [Labrenzia sp. R4_2]MBO9421745.1 hypothetical protein [Labrenzia sp. R4_2]